MAEPGELLRRLGELAGIESGYRDVWGHDHETSDETRFALLKAMGVIREPADAAAALRAQEERDWQPGLPRVSVRRRDEHPYQWEICCGEQATNRALTWTLVLETGESRSGELRPVDLRQSGSREIAGTRLVKFVYQWHEPLPLGYHRFRLDAPDAADGAGMSLVIVPARCYVPPGLEGGARPWGPALQLYAMRSGRNWGIGDFTDLRNATEFFARAGAGMVGLNPLHALFPDNPGASSPYSPSSRRYLNPLYIDVEAIPEFSDCRRAREQVEQPAFQAQLRALRSSELVDYPAVAHAKIGVLRAVYQAFREREVPARTPRAAAFDRFVAEGGEGLLQFALYHALQADFHSQDASVWGWPAWPEPYRDPGAPAVTEYREAHRERIGFYAWLQWIADEQLAACGQRSQALGLAVGLYQDLAVSIDGGGAEAWAARDLYATAAHVGSPPDEYNLYGQNWGLPPPIPERLTQSAYAPFVATVRANMKHAGALRFDHVMGLTRLFWVPQGANPDRGAYIRYPFQDLVGILALESERNRCMVIGEDLGTLPEGFAEQLQGAGIYSYRPLLFEKEPDGSFRPPAAYPEQAVATTGTHDLPTLKGFWLGHDLDVRARLNLFPSDEHRERQVVDRARDRAWLLVALQRESLLPPGVSVHPAPATEMTPDLALAIQAYVARSRARLMVVQMEDVLGQLDQVNLPASGEPYPNWRRRLSLNLEEWPGDARVLGLVERLRGLRGTGTDTRAAVRRAVQEAKPVIPRATYRLQFSREFTFAQATRIVPYLAALGVSHVYCSPYLKARPGSLHGYDIVDHGSLNPEIGSEADFEAFVAALKSHGMGQIMDIVPNHMGVMGADNDYWLDVLENGPASERADVFDIEWRAAKEGHSEKIVVPALAGPYGAVLERGDLKLAFDAARGEFSVWYFAHRFPIDPRHYPLILGHAAERLAERLGADHPDALEYRSLITVFENLPERAETRPDKWEERRREKEVHKRHLAALVARSHDVAHLVDDVVKDINGVPGDSLTFNALHALLEAQAYRLAYWRVASNEVNYRRFFDINDLAALRAENPEVFEFTHRLVLRLLDEGKVDGLRIDHPDGLLDPLQYFRRLQRRQAQPPPPDGAEAAFRSTYVVVEKVLAREERLPVEWPVHGTTGYEFMNLVNGLLLDSAAGTRLERCYRLFTRETQSAEEILYRSKRIIMRTALAGELNVLAQALARIADVDRHTRDFTLGILRYALREIVACFPVYRTYFSPGRAGEDDRRHVDTAVRAAKRRSTAGDVSVFDFVRDVMLTSIADGRGDAYRQQVVSFAMKLQQYTAPVTAKGTEDTAFYLYNRLISLNEVGGDPGTFGVTLTTFHRANRERQRSWPHGMLATSTHDNKRSEDVRARLNVLSELSEDWRANVVRWSRLNRDRKARTSDAYAPTPNDEYFIYQTLLGAWPLHAPDEATLAGLRDRVRNATLKAVREAKAQSSWLNPNAAYEAATLGFIDALLAPGTGNAFLGEFVPFQRKVARLGLMNSLSQVVLKLTVPGVPDIYQGNELWDFSLVDPDNRRPVDYAVRANALAFLRQAAEHGPDALRQTAEMLFSEVDDGRLKLFVTWRLLQLRARRVGLFRDGDYVPLRARGPRANNVCGFRRQHGKASLVVVASRWFSRLMPSGRAPLAGAAWEETALEVPAGSWTNVLTGEVVTVPGSDGVLALAQLFATLPWAVLIPAPDDAA